jgi:hypothetical protein
MERRLSELKRIMEASMISLSDMSDAGRAEARHVHDILRANGIEFPGSGQNLTGAVRSIHEAYENLGREHHALSQALNAVQEQNERYKKTVNELVDANNANATAIGNARQEYARAQAEAAQSREAILASAKEYFEAALRSLLDPEYDQYQETLTDRVKTIIDEVFNDGIERWQRVVQPLVEAEVARQPKPDQGPDPGALVTAASTKLQGEIQLAEQRLRAYVESNIYTGLSRVLTGTGRTDNVKQLQDFLADVIRRGAGLVSNELAGALRAEMKKMVAAEEFGQFRLTWEKSVKDFDDLTRKVAAEAGTLTETFRQNAASVQAVTGRLEQAGRTVEDAKRALAAQEGILGEAKRIEGLAPELERYLGVIRQKQGELTSALQNLTQAHRLAVEYRQFRSKAESSLTYMQGEYSALETQNKTLKSELAAVTHEAQRIKHEETAKTARRLQTPHPQRPTSKATAAAALPAAPPAPSPEGAPPHTWQGEQPSPSPGKPVLPKAARPRQQAALPMASPETLQIEGQPRPPPAQPPPQQKEGEPSPGAGVMERLFKGRREQDRRAQERRRAEMQEIEDRRLHAAKTHSEPPGIPQGTHETQGSTNTTYIDTSPMAMEEMKRRQQIELDQALKLAQERLGQQPPPVKAPPAILSQTPVYTPYQAPGTEGTEGQEGSGQVTSEKEEHLRKKGLSDDELQTLVDKSGTSVRKHIRGIFSRDELSDAKLPKNEVSGLIVNTDPSTKPGMHWVAVFVDPRPSAKSSVEYFDSFGQDPSRGMNDSINEMIKKNFSSLPHMLKYKINSVKNQRATSPNCGFFALKFLSDRIHGVPFETATGFKKLSQVAKGEHGVMLLKKKFGYI